ASAAAVAGVLVPRGQERPTPAACAAAPATPADPAAGAALQERLPGAQGFGGRFRPRLRLLRLGQAQKVIEGGIQLFPEPLSLLEAMVGVWAFPTQEVGVQEGGPHGIAEGAHRDLHLPS